MEFKFFSRNGELLPIEQATVPLSNIEYSYGFGVYETIRVTNRIPYFIQEHLERLAGSASAVGLEHAFSQTAIKKAISALLKKNDAETCNIKILLVGGSSTSFDKTQDNSLRTGHTKEDASLYIFCLNPLFPDKKLYRDGVHCITYPYERMFPHAKTLNMLGSYLAYRKAREAGAYDALLLNHKKHILEGTRTNFFCISASSKGGPSSGGKAGSASGGKGTIISPPEKNILPGVTRHVLMHIAKKHGYTFEEGVVTPHHLTNYDGAFLTSTSSKIMPIRSIDSHTLGRPSPALRELMELFDEFLKNCRGTLT